MSIKLVLIPSELDFQPSVISESHYLPCSPPSAQIKHCPLKSETVRTLRKAEYVCITPAEEAAPYAPLYAFPFAEIQPLKEEMWLAAWPVAEAAQGHVGIHPKTLHPQENYLAAFAWKKGAKLLSTLILIKRYAIERHYHLGASESQKHSSPCGIRNSFFLKPPRSFKSILTNVHLTLAAYHYVREGKVSITATF